MLIKCRSPFDEFVNEFFGGSGYQRDPLASTNIEEKEKGYIISIMLPGFQKKDIKIDIQDGILTIKGKVEDVVKERKYIRQEFSQKSFVRSFTIPDDINNDKITAKCENGVLEVELNKLESSENEPKNIDIQ